MGARQAHLRRIRRKVDECEAVLDRGGPRHFAGVRPHCSDLHAIRRDGHHALFAYRRDLHECRSARKAALRIVHVDEIRPYRPLPLFRSDTIVQHYMQPEEFKQFHERALAAADAEGSAPSAEDADRERRIAEVYDMFVQAKVMRR